jgi:GTP-binding protein
MILLSSARFFTTVAKPAQLPLGGLPEIAFVGRSNAGKSSCINALCNQKKLAFSSKTPGRTQALNFFGLGQKKEEDLPQAFLVDTPGYGYAEASLEAQKQWSGLSGAYLGDRACLKGVVLVMDIRRGVTDKDRALINFCAMDMPILIAISKADKFSKMQQAKQVLIIKSQVAELRPSQPITFQPFSVLSKLGFDEARKWISERIAPTPRTQVVAQP